MIPQVALTRDISSLWVDIFVVQIAAEGVSAPSGGKKRAKKKAVLFEKKDQKTLAPRCVGTPSVLKQRAGGEIRKQRFFGSFFSKKNCFSLQNGFKSRSI
jgi:hypothetical protein